MSNSNTVNPINYFHYGTSGNKEKFSTATLKTEKFILDFGEDAHSAYVNYRHAMSSSNSEVDVEQNRKMFIKLVGVDPDEFYKIGQTTTELI